MTTWSLHYHRKVRDNPYDSNSFSEPASPSNADSSNFSTPWSWTNATGLQPSRLFYITDRDTGLCFLIDTGAQSSLLSLICGGKEQMQQTHWTQHGH
ncbi:hypothetical protein GBAR_LOCUS11582, partial [Geodia barretti]